MFFPAKRQALAFLPKGGGEGTFYAYAYPEPDGYSMAELGVPGTVYNTDSGRWLLPIEIARSANAPGRVFTGIFDAVFRCQAELADWEYTLAEGPKTVQAR